MTGDRARLLLEPPVSPEAIVREVKQLPAAPKVLPRLKQLLCDGNSAMDEISALIRLDQAIASRVLQVSNSAYFSKGVRCLTVDEAIGRVGFKQVYELVSYAVASQVLVRPLEVYGLEANEMWRRSVVAAFAAEIVAQRKGMDGNDAYTVGLLHGVGMVAINEWAMRRAPGLRLEGAGFPVEAVEAERRFFGFTQAEVGGALLKGWDFPGAVVEVVRGQHLRLDADKIAGMPGVLRLAKWLRDAAGVAHVPAPVDEELLRVLEIDSEQLEGMLGEIRHRLEEVQSLLSLAGTMAPQGDGQRTAPCHWPSKPV